MRVVWVRGEWGPVMRRGNCGGEGEGEERGVSVGSWGECACVDMARGVAGSFRWVPQG